MFVMSCCFKRLKQLYYGSMYMHMIMYSLYLYRPKLTVAQWLERNVSRTARPRGRSLLSSMWCRHMPGEVKYSTQVITLTLL